LPSFVFLEQYLRAPKSTSTLCNKHPVRPRSTIILFDPCLQLRFRAGKVSVDIGHFPLPLLLLSRSIFTLVIIIVVVVVIVVIVIVACAQAQVLKNLGEIL